LEPQALGQLGRYELVSELGRGGMGRVYSAREPSTSRLVALKTLERAEPGLVTLFEREYQTLASIAHPRVIAVHDFGIGDDGRRFYTMELVGGADLASLPRLEVPELCTHLRDVATCLVLLHARRLVHRDVSPRNIRLDEHGRAKLLDFGALCSFGRASELVGTPQCIPPEALARGELDQRADIFALGVVGYWALTGEAPYPARTLADVAAAHAHTPRPLSELRSGVPRQLEQLIMAMIRVDPLERPSSAAEVIERLEAMMGDEAGEPETAASAHLASRVCVGRGRETQQLRQYLSRTLAGSGALVVLEGAPGMGTTRLAHDLGTDARLAGAAVLTVDAGSELVLRQATLRMVRALLSAAPAEARETLPRYAMELAEAFPGVAELHELAGSASARASYPTDPLERRARVQDALAGWVVAVSERVPVVLLVDDLASLDPAATGALLALAHAAPRGRLLVVGTLGTDEGEGLALRQLVARMAARIKLRGLGAAEMDELVASVFGEVPNRVRLAQWLHRATGGNPGHAFALLKVLVARGVVTYRGGAFQLPEELSEVELPGSLEDSVAADLGRLGPLGLRLARALALYRGTLGREALGGLVGHAVTEQLDAALAELTAHDVLRREAGPRYGFRQELLRRAVLSRIGEDERRALCADLAATLMGTEAALFEAVAEGRAHTLSTAQLNLALHVGGYLIDAGQLVRAQLLMRESAIELSVRGDGFSEAVPALEAALRAYRAHGVSEFDQLHLIIPLVLAGTYVDHRLGYRYGEAVLDTLARATGVSLALGLRRFAGPTLGLWLGLMLGYVRYVVSGEARRLGRDFTMALLALIGLSSALIGAAIVLDDRARAEAVLNRLAPLDAFPARHPLRTVRSFQHAMVRYVTGDLGGSRQLALEALERLQSPAAARQFPEEARAQLEVGILALTGPLHALRTDGSTHRDLSRLEQVPTATSRQVAEAARAAYHGHRGERPQSLLHHERLDVLAAQSGSTWRHDVGVPRLLWSTHVLCEDVMGLKRCLRALEHWAEEVPSLRRVRDVVHAAYVSERGMHREALQRFEPVLAQWTSERGLAGARAAGLYARILRMAGRADDARALCERVLNALRASDRAFTMAVIGVELEGAAALLALGQCDRAAAALDALLVRHANHDNPLVRGLVHQQRARVALEVGDAAELERHLGEAEQWFRRTQNPALAAQYQRLVDDARARGLLQTRGPSARRWHEGRRSLPEVHVAFDACRGPAERLQVAIDAVLAASGAEYGYLYLMEREGLRFVAPSVGAEPPDELRAELEAELLDRTRASAAELRAEFRTETLVADDEVLAGIRARASHYRSVLLTLERNGQHIAVGALALVPGEEPVSPLAPELLEAVAGGLYGAGDVHTVFIAPRPRPADNENA
jgi:Protein kinase domain/AAA ATPase domain